MDLKNTLIELCLKEKIDINEDGAEHLIKYKEYGNTLYVTHWR